MEQVLLLAALFFVAAVLYGMVGHAGASAYLAIMALAGVSPEVMRPTALVLNILVASIVTLRFARAGYVRPMSALPFLIGSIPAAFIGGAILLPPELYRPLVGAVLIVAAFRFGVTATSSGTEFPPRAPALLAVISGAVIGLLAGLTGTGGGIFLTPLLLAAGWAGTRFAAGTSALSYLQTRLRAWPATIRPWATFQRPFPSGSPPSRSEASSVRSWVAGGYRRHGCAADWRWCCSSRV